jgi:hypothetical protein
MSRDRRPTMCTPLCVARANTMRSTFYIDATYLRAIRIT